MLENRSANAVLCYDTLANFYLMHLAMVFDLKDPKSFQEIQQRQLTTFRLQFIKKRWNPDLLQQLQASVENYVATHLSD